MTEFGQRRWVGKGKGRQRGRKGDKGRGKEADNANGIARDLKLSINIRRPF